jgi:ATP-dependent DNA ligase
MRMAYELCLATAGKQVPSGPDWIHEVKHDGYRMLVIRENDRVRLLSRNGSDWTRRYPWIAEAALKNRQRHFVIDGEAAILGVDGNSDFNALHSRKHDHEVLALRLRHSGDGWRRSAVVAPCTSQDQPRTATGPAARRHHRCAL